MKGSIVVLLFLGVLFGEARSQPASIQVHVYHQPDSHPDAELLKELSQSLRNALALRGIRSDGNQLHLFGSALTLETSTEELVVASFVLGYGLSEAMLEAAGESELFYAGKLHSELPEEGSQIRKYMSREFFEQVVTVGEIRVLHFRRAEMETHIDQFVDELLEQPECLETGECRN